MNEADALATSKHENKKSLIALSRNRADRRRRP
jgi:hypothetical protein